MIDFNFKDKDISEVIKKYSKESGEIFIYSNVKGKVTIETPNKISIEAARNLFLESLANLSFGIIIKNGTNVIIPLRELMRSGIPVVTTLPKDDKEVYMSYIYTPKHETAQEVMKAVTRLLSANSSVDLSNNDKVLITDWLSNLKKIDKILKEFDQPKKK
jgi:type II secretory pathway component GspD/PulD (secretin)